MSVPIEGICELYPKAIRVVTQLYPKAWVTARCTVNHKDVFLGHYEASDGEVVTLRWDHALRGADGPGTDILAAPRRPFMFWDLVHRRFLSIAQDPDGSWHLHETAQPAETNRGWMSEGKIPAGFDEHMFPAILRWRDGLFQRNPKDDEQSP